MLDHDFQLPQHGTTVRTEPMAGLTTFLTMAYILFVNPAILGAAGMPKDAVVVATWLVAAIGSGIMGLYANYPIGMAPGMGLNAYCAFAVVLGMDVPGPQALGAVFISGCLFLLVSVTGLRALSVKRHTGAAAHRHHGRHRPVPGTDRIQRRGRGRGQQGHHARRRQAACARGADGQAARARRDPDRHPGRHAVPAYATAPAAMSVACLPIAWVIAALFLFKFAYSGA